MSNVINLRSKKAAREKVRPNSYLIIDHPSDPTFCLGTIEVYDAHVVARPYECPTAQRRYILDTRLEGARLLLRLHALHHAVVTPVKDGVFISLPPVAAGGDA